ncbi:MAG: ABC transporter ATP-binding protein [Azonexus sp.]|nr:ABC transporter ATP-binding protein [Azonexus sp.]
MRATNLSKTYVLYDRPVDRLLQALWRGRRQYGRRFAALAEVSFELPRGAVLGIVGKNGAGKSTLLQMICGTLTPSSGSIEVQGRVAALLELGAGFNPEFTGRENVFMNAAILGLPEYEIRQRFDEIAAFSGIGAFIEQPMKTYSSGMTVRLAFAIATCVDPDILIIDEALSVGDGVFARKSFDRIMALKEKGATILFCSHSMYHIEAICDQALWLEQGRIMMLDAPERVTRAYIAALAAEAAGPSMATHAAPISTPVMPGTGGAYLLEVTVTADGVTGRRLVLRAGVSDLNITIRFQVDPQLPPPAVAFGLETMAGAAVSSGSTHLDGVTPVTDADGRGTVRLNFPHMPLMRGTFRLAVFLMCERGLHVYDHATYCAELEVMHDDPAQGVCFLPHAWRTGSIENTDNA